MEILWQVFFKVSAYVNSPVFLRSFFDNRFYLILLVIVLMRFKYTTYRSMWMSALVNIPGTFLHELMHYLVGSFFNARPVNFTIFPQRGPEGRLCHGKRGVQQYYLLQCRAVGDGAVVAVADCFFI